MSFVHLHVHTEYSFDAMSNIEKLFARADKMHMPGLAITDHGTLAGIPEFLSVAERFPLVRPIVGCEFFLGEDACHLILLAKNQTGYKNLFKLSSLSISKQAPRYNRISHEMLELYHEGLICTSACIGGEIPQRVLAGRPDEAMAAALWYQRVFGDDFYLEVSLHESKDPVTLGEDDIPAAYRKNNEALVQKQKESNAAIFLLGTLLDIKVVATNDIHFVDKEDGIVHDRLLCIMRNCRVSDENRRRYSHLEYLKSEQEMRQLFPGHPEVIENTLKVLDKVKRYDTRHRKIS